MRFSVIQLFALVAISAVLICLAVDRWTVKYPWDDVADAMRVNNHPDWSFVEHIGSEEGPFRWVGANGLYSDHETVLTYSIDGESIRLVIPKNTYGNGDWKIERFENKNHDSLILISEYTGPQSPDVPK